MRIVTRKIEELTPHPKNYRKHPPNQVAKLADSLRFHKQPKPVVITADNVILAGHGLVDAARLAGWSSVECSIYEGADPEAFLVMDNRSAALAVDDTHQLAALLHDLTNAEANPLAIGFDEQEIADLLKQLDADSPVPEFAPASEEEQGRLDEKKTVTCPECGHVFIP